MFVLLFVPVIAWAIWFCIGLYRAERERKVQSWINSRLGK